jgi:hypothetical protein
MKQARAFHRCERGAVFVQVGIAATVLVAFNVFVLDYGMMWVSRRQAQNAADAGALAGAVARAYDDFGDPPSTSGLAAQIAETVAESNLVWKVMPPAQVSFGCPPGVTARCVRVDVYRNGQFGSPPLPTLFGPLLGVGNQGVKATATAVVANGNATNCLKPWAIPDHWAGNSPTNKEFNGPPDDLYVTTSGYTTVAVSHNERVVWNLSADPLLPATPILREPPGVDAPPAQTVDVSIVPLRIGAASHLTNMTQCSGTLVSLGSTLPVDTSASAGDKQTAVTQVMSLDPGADYDYDNERVINSCAPSCAPVSPRLLAVALYDPDRFQRGRATGDWASVGCPTANPCVTIKNIVGLFLHGAFGGYGAHGHVIKYPGMLAASAPNYPDEASWLMTTNLVR